MGRMLLLLSVSLAASSAPPAAAGSPASVFSYVCTGRLREGALQHVQGRDHCALFHLTLLVLMRRGAVVVVSRSNFQSLGLELKLELGGCCRLCCCCKCTSGKFLMNPQVRTDAVGRV